MKKFLSVLLVLVLTLSLGTVAFAAGETDMSQVEITIKYTATNMNTISPEETLQFTATNNGVTDGKGNTVNTTQPSLTIPAVQLTQGLAGNGTGGEAKLTITLPSVGTGGFETVGVYEYTITPTAGTSGGVAYHTNNIKLYVTVMQGDNDQLRIAAVHAEQNGGYNAPGTDGKTDEIDMTYSAGQLKVTKTVTGNMGDRDKYFKVAVTLTGEQNKNYAQNYTVTGGSKIENGTNDCTASTITVGKATAFYLKNGETIIIENLPYGVTYTVEEDGTYMTSEGYDAPVYTYSDSGETKSMSEAEETVTITNNKGMNVDTGIGLDNLPYIMMLAFVGVGLAVFFVKKRSSREN